MAESHGLATALMVLAAALAAAVLFRRVRLSPVLGYLLAGVLVGPHGLGVVGDPEAAERLAEFGVVFLLFSVGLELSLDRLLAMRRQVFGMGTLQVLLTGAALFAGARLLGVPTIPALVLSGALALSSTAVVLRLLAEQRRVHTPLGRAAVAVLLMQDLAVVPMLALVPLLGGTGPGAMRALGVAGLKGLAAVALIVLLGRVALRPILRAVAATRSPELFTGTTLLIALGVGWATGLAGLSMALGAFLAGLVLAETEFRHQVEADIEPFRALLLALFFVTVGMGLDLGLAASRAPLLLALVAGLVAVKAAVLWGLARAFGHRSGEAAALGLTLAQGGEFAFVVFTLAVGSGALDAEVARLAVAVVAVSIAVTPLLVLAANRLARHLEDPGQAGVDRVAAEAETVARHVIIAGFGRVGQTLARLLDALEVEYVALDQDPERVREGRAAGLPVHFGNASRIDVLRAAGVHRALASVVTLDDPAQAERAVAAIRQEMPGLPVVVRARDASHSRELEDAGATRVVPELVEGSLQLGGALLQVLGEPAEVVERVLGRFRDEAYARLEDLPATGARAEPGAADGAPAAARGPG